MRNKKGFMILRAVFAIWLGIGGLVALVVLHPLVHALITEFLSGSTDTIQNFAVRMIEVFYVLMLFASMLITLVTGE
jgi:hypothetical protein